MADPPERWKRVAFNDAIDFREGPGILAKDFRTEGVPLIRLAGLTGKGSVLSGCNYLDPEAVEERWSHFRVREGDTLLSTSASLGRTGVVDRFAEGAIPYTGIIRMRPAIPGAVLPEFIPFLLQGPDFQQQASVVGGGSVMTHFGPSHLRTMTLLLPPLEDQRAIAEVLGAVDDKIESNRRRAAVSESLLDLLAFALVGPRTIPVGELVEVERNSCSPAALGEVLVDHFSLPAFDASRLPDRTPGESIKSNKLVVAGESVLVSRLNPGTNRTWFAVPEPGVMAAASTEFMVLRPGSRVGLGGLWLAVRDEFFRSELARRATGTSGSHQRVRPDDLLSIEVPDVRALDAAQDAEAEGLLRLVHQARTESATLADLRDALLPELLSGRMRVPVAEELVDAG